MLNFEKILLIASKTPSGDNLQPWLFKVNEEGNQLSIYYDHVLAAHAFNPENITMTITFGMMLFSIEEEALRQGYMLETKIYEPGLVNSNEVFIDCFFKPNSTARFSLFSQETVFKRRVGRGIYQKKKLPIDEMKLFLNEINRGNDLIQFSIAEKITQDTFKSMKNMEYCFWNKKTFLQDIFKWVHFTRSDYDKVRRGFHWKELGLNQSELFFIYLIKNFTSFAIKLFNVFAHLLIFNKLSKSLDNAGFILVNLKRRPNTTEWIEIGKSVMSIWLKIAEFEMVTQPLSIHSFFIGFSKWGINAKDWPEDVIANLEGNLKRNFLINESYTPFWLFRFGYSYKKDNVESLRIPTDKLKAS